MPRTATALLLLLLAGAPGLALADAPRVRIDKAFALSVQDDLASLVRLSELAQDPHEGVRLAAVHGLARRGAFARVTGSLSDPAPRVRYLARKLVLLR